MKFEPVEFTVNLQEISSSRARGPKLAPGQQPPKILLEGVSFIAQPKQFKLDTDSLAKESRAAHTDLYVKSCERFTRLSAELSSASAAADAGRVRDLSREIAAERNSVWLHELFFSGSFCRNSQVSMSSLAYSRIARDFGDFNEWQRDVIARSAGREPCWIVTAADLFLRKYVNFTITGDAASTLLGVMPVIVIDCWEHAYERDFGSDKQRYVAKMMSDIDWDVVNDRFARADAVMEALK